MTNAASTESLSQSLPGRAGQGSSEAATGFAALLQALGDGLRQAQTATGEATPSSSTADPVGGGSAGGLMRSGATAAELLEMKLGLAQGLRGFEAEVTAAVKQALAGGGSSQADAIVSGAARIVGALLGQADAQAGTNALALLGKKLDALEAAMKQAEATPERAPGDDDPLKQVEALFGWISNALGITRPTADSRVTGSQLLVANALAGSSSGASGKGAADSGAAAKGAGPASVIAPAAAPDLAEALRRMAARGEVPTHAPAAQAQTNQTQAILGAAAAAMAGQAAPSEVPAEKLKALVQTVLTGGERRAEARRTEGGASGADVFGLLSAARQVAPAAHTAALAQAGDAPGLAQNAARFSGMVSGQIRSASVTGDHTRIELEPRGLGAVEIDMKRDAAGKMQVVVRAENPMVLATLRNDQETLANILAGSGAAGAGATLDFQDMGGRGRSGERAVKARPGVAAAGEDEGEGAAEWQPTIARGRLDIRT